MEHNEHKGHNVMNLVYNFSVLRDPKKLIVSFEMQEAFCILYDHCVSWRCWRYILILSNNSIAKSAKFSAKNTIDFGILEGFCPSKTVSTTI